MHNIGQNLRRAVSKLIINVGRHRSSLSMSKGKLLLSLLQSRLVMQRRSSTSKRLKSPEHPDTPISLTLMGRLWNPTIFAGFRLCAERCRSLSSRDSARGANSVCMASGSDRAPASTGRHCTGGAGDLAASLPEYMQDAAWHLHASSWTPASGAGRQELRAAVGSCTWCPGEAHSSQDFPFDCSYKQPMATINSSRACWAAQIVVQDSTGLASAQEDWCNAFDDASLLSPFPSFHSWRQMSLAGGEHTATAPSNPAVAFSIHRLILFVSIRLPP